jgi:bidirectional [NiFe] hydrogenase diaphorase subunit
MIDKNVKTHRPVQFMINDQPVEAEESWTVLETAREYGIHIPSLCYHEAVEASGGCRLCVVEAREGNWAKVVISCMYPVKSGLTIYTDTEKVNNVRRWVLEMLLAECPASKEIKNLAAQYGVKSTRFEIKNPQEQCMLCGLCVRVCREVVGVSAITTVGRGVYKFIGTPFNKVSEECVACGSCVTICPTGAMKTRLNAVRGAVGASKS